MPTLYLYHHRTDSACLYHRFLLPSRFCSPAVEAAGGRVALTNHFPDTEAKPGDWFAFHGIPGDASVIVAIARLKQKGVRFLWSVDDSWLEIPDWNPAQLSADGEGVYRCMVDLADGVLCSTRHLAGTFVKEGVPTYTAPNLMDLSRFPDPPDTLKVELPVRLVWVGGITHKGDVEVCESALDRVLRKLGPAKVAVVFFGMKPPPRLTRDHLHRGLLHQPEMPFPQYQNILNSIKPDVCLAPLADIPFNYSKSNIRVLEAWGLLGAPVASPVGEYACVRSGEDGRYAASADEWESALTRLATDHEYRLDLAVAGRRRVEREYSWAVPACRRPWLDAIGRILDVTIPPEE